MFGCRTKIRLFSKSGAEFVLMWSYLVMDVSFMNFVLHVRTTLCKGRNCEMSNQNAQAGVNKLLADLRGLNVQVEIAEKPMRCCW